MLSAALRTRRFKIVAGLVGLAVVLLAFSASTPVTSSTKDFGKKLLRPHSNSDASPSSAWDPIAQRHEARNMLDPYAEKVFVSLKSGATVIQERLAAQVRTTLTRWPYYAVYADIGGKIAGEDVVDIIKYLTPEHQQSDQLADYHLLQKAINENWNWGPNDLAEYAGWDTDKFKNIPMMAHTWEHAPDHIEWFVYFDDDSYIFQENLLDYLRTLDPKEKIYLGRPADWESTGLGKDGAEHPIAFAHGGSGVVISRGAMEALYGPNPKRDRSKLEKVVKEGTDRVLWHCCGDSAFAMVMYQFADELEISQPWGRYSFYNTPFQGASLRDIAIADEGWCLPVFTWHHLTPREVDELFDYEQYIMPRGHITTFDDIYHHFMLPYIADQREGWDAAAGKYVGEWETQYNWVLHDDFANDERSQMFSDGEGGFTLSPSTSMDDCKALCEMIPECLVWTYQQGRCAVEKNVVFRGQASNGLSKKIHEVHEEDEFAMNSMTSGWMLDRLRQRRAKAECDSLQYSESSNSFSDDEKTSEGWYLRKIAESKE